jgi:thioredoxin reductase (NADPH)
MSVRNVIVIGSGPAGLTAALYTARANLKPLVIEGLEAGGQLMLTTLVENFPGFREGIDGPDLISTMREQAQHFGTEIIRGNVTSVDLLTQPFTVKTSDAEYRTRALIVATGASARLLGLASERTLMGHGVSTCATCDGYFFLTRFASHVTVVHRRETLRASKIMQDKAFGNPKISFEWNAEVEEIKDTGKGEVTSMVIRNHQTGEVKDIPVDGVFVAIGHNPNTTLFNGQLDTDANGYIVTHSGSRTSVPGVFACGDVQDHVYRQAITAAGSGCMAAIDAEKYLEGLPQHLGEAAHVATLE